MVGCLPVLLSAWPFKHKAYENPITKDTQQPDKVLFDKAIHDIEHSRYEIARLTLQTLINTYDTSEYLAKAKLAIADSWYREGGAHGLAQAEAEYKDFILFYPQMEEAAEAQEKVCDIHYKQMDKPDRDDSHAIRAQDECRQLVVQFPNSKFAPQAQQRLRDIQEVLAQEEYNVGMLYHKKGSYPAAANRLLGVGDQYPLFSKADEALWNLADSYRRMGDRFENQEVGAYTRIVRDYPLSAHAEESKQRLQAMNRPVPEADPTAIARMKYEQENHKKPGIPSRAMGPFSSKPDLSMAAKTGAPSMQTQQPSIPVSVPSSAGGPTTPGGATGVSAEVSAAVVSNTTALDQGQDARARPADQTAAGGSAPAATAATDQQPLPSNHTAPKPSKKASKKKAQPAAPAVTTTPPSGDAPASTPAPPQQ